MTDHELDRLADEYLAALHTGDESALGRIWELAAFNPELETTLHELHAALDDEDRLRDAKAAEPAIADAVRKHLPSAETSESTAGPVTVGDVARELFRHTPGGLPVEAHALNESLQHSTEPLPDNLGLSKLIAWIETKFGNVPLNYGKVFQQVALKLERRRASAVDYQLAARRAAKPEEPK